jgi:hypothetical protein
VDGKGLYREGKVGGSGFRPKKRIKEEVKTYKNRWEVDGKGLYREGKVGGMTFGQRIG